MHQLKPVVLWMTGLSGAGKSTIAYALEKKLQQEGVLCEVLDGDTLRQGLNADLGFSETDRLENIRRTAELAKILCLNKFVVICSLITPTNEIRELARKIIAEQFKLIHISTPIGTCRNRDVKGLYKKADSGEIKNFTGINSPFEYPDHADLAINTEHETEGQSVERLYLYLKDL
ncbi:MAG: adenylyl-sulfate kinase [Bacteroidia bacterium]